MERQDERKTGIVYHDHFLLHDNYYHPECKERLKAIMKKLKDTQILDRLELIAPAEKADPQTIALVHDESYIREVERACRAGDQSLDPDTYLSWETFDVASLAVQGGLEAVRSVMSGRLRNVFALLRPPGHHAEAGRAMGYCIFNNIAIAARFLQKEYGLQRIMILDWDVHHGNGTQHIFEKDPGVLFFSFHQSPAYPGTGAMWEVGEGEGRGYTINATMPPSCNDKDYLTIFNEAVIPVMDSYRPEILLVSAGQDAYQGDPLASMRLTPQCYAQMTELLLQGAERHCGGKIAFFLEGGYNQEGLASIVYNILNTMAGFGLPLEIEPLSEKGGYGAEVLYHLRSIQQEFWPIFK